MSSFSKECGFGILLSKPCANSTMMICDEQFEPKVRKAVDSRRGGPSDQNILSGTDREQMEMGLKGRISMLYNQSY